MVKIKDKGSFRDPNGQIYYENGKVLREIGFKYRNDYDMLMKSGLYKELTSREMLVKHKEVGGNKQIFKIIEPELIPFISYPYEWCFSQLKVTALLTLSIQKVAMEFGMSLKDASSYNVQFVGTKPVFIDTLSFEKYKEDEGWVAYRQFCRHFLAPLALMAMADGSLGKILANYLDGVPLELAEQLLPFKSRLNFGTLSHIHLNAKSQKMNIKNDKKYKISKQQLTNILTSLEMTIDKFELKKKETEWGDYYGNTNYSMQAFASKKTLVEKYLKKSQAKSMLDLGANTGEFSVIGAGMGIYTLSTDYDWMAVEKNYLGQKDNSKLLPLIIDITNPSSAIGWANEERKSFWQRAKVDVVLALALIHHLAIANNLPFENIAEMLSKISKFLIIEFVPKDDSKVKILLSTREDIFDRYSEEEFEKVFGKYFEILETDKVVGSKRIIYFMKKK